MTNEIEVYCLNCGKEKWSNITATHKETYQHPTEPFTAWERHHLVQCKTCKGISYLSVSTNSEDMDFHCDSYGEPTATYKEQVERYPPIPPREPAWMIRLADKDWALFRTMQEIYLAQSHGLTILSTAGLRTAFDRLTAHLDIDPALDFNKKLNELRAKLSLDDATHKDLNILVEAGSAAAHRSWDPGSKVVQELLEYLEGFIEKVLFPAKPKSLAHLVDGIPPKPQRRDRPPK